MAFFSTAFKVDHAKRTLEQLPLLVAIDGHGNEISNRVPARITESGSITNAEPLTIGGPGAYMGLRLVSDEIPDYLDL